MTNNGRGFVRIAFGQFTDPVYVLGVDLALNLGDVDQRRGAAGRQGLAVRARPTRADPRTATWSWMLLV